MNQFEESRELLHQCRQEITKEMVGQKEIIDQLLMVMLSGGNVLLEGMPGLGKTRLVHTISRVFDLSFKRIQFTPDLMPQDITGTSILMRTDKGSEFSFRQGPVFANLVLADEINRATPKAQSALLEAMQEGTVTEGGQTHALPAPFFVLATQNPIETEGTYPLPEAELDRFLCKLNLEFPAKEELKEIVRMTELGEKEKGREKQKAEKICDEKGLFAMMEQAALIPIADPVMDYLTELICATHEPDRYIREGASPRGAQAMLRLSRARAFMEGRYNVSFEDLRYVAPAALRHRLVLSFDAVAEGVTADEVIRRILDNHPVKNGA